MEYRVEPSTIKNTTKIVMHKHKIEHLHLLMEACAFGRECDFSVLYCIQQHKHTHKAIQMSFCGFTTSYSSLFFFFALFKADSSFFLLSLSFLRNAKYNFSNNDNTWNCIVLYCIVFYCIVLYCIGVACDWWYSDTTCDKSIIIGWIKQSGRFSILNILG